MPDMKIREVLSRDPLTTVIPNDGVTKVIQPQSANEWAVLRYELESSSVRVSTDRAWTGCSRRFSQTFHSLSNRPSG